MRILEESLTCFLFRYPCFRNFIPDSVFDERYRYIVRYREDLTAIEFGYPDDEFLLA